MHSINQTWQHQSKIEITECKNHTLRQSSSMLKLIHSIGPSIKPNIVQHVMNTIEKTINKLSIQIKVLYQQITLKLYTTFQQQIKNEFCISISTAVR